MNGAVIFLLVALVAGPVVNATTLFPNRIHPSRYSPRRDAYPWAYRWKYPGAYPDAGFQGGFPQPLQGGYYRDELYDRRRSGLGRPIGPTLLPQYDPYYAGPGNSYLHGAQFDLFDTQASRRSGVLPATAAAVPMNTQTGVYPRAPAMI
ncbi:uncharacterized protein LOC124115863 [Haliotis rufescens]|uniref:uncharacterized protein LOC124115863 n=1 Tax=Haliotis rufescens TaxID=6454 RepID=UPI001EAFB395|nr:uncharacterized protein LOC124115863 [Haliotis rufescens]